MLVVLDILGHLSFMGISPARPVWGNWASRGSPQPVHFIRASHLRLRHLVRGIGRQGLVSGEQLSAVLARKRAAGRLESSADGIGVNDIHLLGER